MAAPCRLACATASRDCSRHTCSPGPMCGQIHPERKRIMKLNQKNATGKPLSTELLSKISAYWRAVSYLSVGQIYLYDNPLLKKPRKLRAEYPHASRRREKDFASAWLISILPR